jgi:hypothetical protein
MFQRYNIRDLATLMEVEKAPPTYVASERKKFGSYRHELKSTVIKGAYFDGFFDSVSLSETDLKYILSGYSPISVTPTGEERKVYTIHHIKPLNCMGETKTSNLIPLPRKFHDFLHEIVIDPQLRGMNVGDKRVLVAMPDFSKINLQMMQDPSFRVQYHKYLVDTYHMLPRSFDKHGRKKDQQQIARWYAANFGHLK